MLENIHLQPLFIVGIIVVLALYAGKSMKWIKLPGVIGFMIVGVILGPSLLDVITDQFQESMSFMTDLALGFIAVGIGLELSFSSLKKQGAGIVTVIFAESIFAFILVTGALYLLTKDLPLSLIFGAIAPASDPAGTVAVIQEYKTKGSLTRALYSVVGFDDGLGIIIFGFAAAFAKSLLGQEMGLETGSMLKLIGTPLLEVGLSVVAGVIIAFLFSLLVKKLKHSRDIFLLLFSFVLIISGMSENLHLSVILTNMIFGIVVVNTQKFKLVEQIHGELTKIMPLLFVMFFTLAGASLKISALPSLGLIGLVYLASRTLGLMSGANLGSKMGKLPTKIQKYLGFGILAQAGVAIGLALIVKADFAEFGVHGAYIGTTIITTTTATSILFSIVGPIFTKYALTKGGEIKA